MVLIVEARRAEEENLYLSDFNYFFCLVFYESMNNSDLKYYLLVDNHSL